MTLVGPNGQPISSTQFKKAKPPATGEAFGRWAGQDLSYLNLPGGGVIGFNLNNLTLADFRNMTDHYQIHSSLAVLSFMQHQAEWRVECEDKKIQKHCQDNLEEIWTQLSRALSTSNWAGFSPNVLQWENDLQGRTTQLTKVKDLVPEDCYVHWKEVDGYAPPGHLKPKLKIYDGIEQWGALWPVPTDASLWYPLLMENGNYYGKKLLKPAFQSWYFSLLLHLFANRYYERFGEPLMVGRAPMDDEVTVGDQQVGSRDYMMQIIQNIRSRAAVVLPGDKNADDLSAGVASPGYEYGIEYLESQMRGADFERYMTRLDEEMSIGLFTPILLMRTADVGSYNLGVGHMQMYLWMLNAMNGDRKQYIDKYVLSRMVDFNFSPNAPRAKIVFRKMGNSNMDTIRAVLTELIKSGKAKPDIEELGQLAGLNLKEVRELTAPAPEPTDETDDGADDGADDGSSTDSGGNGTPTDTAKNIKARVRGQLNKGMGKGPVKIDLGYKRQMEKAMHGAGIDPARAHDFYRRMEMVVTDLHEVPFKTVEDCMAVFEPMLDLQLEAVLSA